MCSNVAVLIYYDVKVDLMIDCFLIYHTSL